MAHSGLEGLPTELQHHVLSYLTRPLSCYTVDGMPRTVEEYEHMLELSTDKTAILRHPFLQLAATSRYMRATVEAYCQHLLHQHKDTIKAPAVDVNRDWSNWVATVPRNKRKTRGARMLWIKGVWKHCWFCGRSSVKRAIFDLLLYCCKTCDIRHYGKRVVSILTLHICPRSQLNL